MKRNVKFASGIMLFSLIGLLAFQAYWISSIYRENRSTFEADLQATLASANKSLLIQKLGLMGGLDINFSDNNTMSVTVIDTFRMKESGDRINVLANFSQRYIIADSGLHQVTPHEDTTESGSYIIRQFRAQSLAPLLTGSFHSVISYGDFFYLDSLVKEKLEDKGVKEDYFLGFWDNNNHRFEYTNRPIIDSTKRGNGYSTHAFSIGKGVSNEIYLELPEKHVIKASLAGMGKVIAASILMLLLLLSAWYYIIRSLQKQYHLAQIKDDFIDNMTHELKTPVTASSIALEVMSKNSKIESDQKLKDLLGIAQHEQKRILQIVNSILDNTTSEESISEKLERINANEEIEAIAESMRLTIEEKGGQLSLVIPSTPSFVTVSRMHFQNAILNILDNAQKYSLETPIISVSMKVGLKEIEIQISDKGVGISNEDLKRIFDKFFRVHTGNVHTVKGYGLGLSYTKSVIRQYGGSITVLSTEGEGTTFIVKIPKSIE